MSFAQRQRVITMLQRQQLGLCAGPGCGIKLRTPVIDHDHDTDLVRGLLCTGCNTAEGRLGNKENPDWVAYRAATPAMALGLEVSYWSL